MDESKVEEAIEPTLLSSDEENVFDRYTYQYIISERLSTNPNVINCTVDNPSEGVPILVECERKAEPTIWTLRLESKETKYVFYNSEATINEILLK